MVVQRGKSAVDLLGQDGAGEFMGQGEGGEGEERIGAGTPLGRKPVVAPDDEGEVAGVEAGLPDEVHKGRGVNELAGWVKQERKGGGVAQKGVIPAGVDLAHGAGLEAGRAFDELGGKGRGMFVACAADVKKMNGQKPIIGPRPGLRGMLHDGCPMRHAKRFSSPALRRQVSESG